MSNFDFTMMIDWREWKDWSGDYYGGLTKLNRLLATVGVRLVNIGPETGADYLQLKVEVIPFVAESITKAGVENGNNAEREGGMTVRLSAAPDCLMTAGWLPMNLAPKTGEEIIILFDSATVDIVRLCDWNDGSSDQNGYDGDKPDFIGWWSCENSVTTEMIDTDLMTPLGWLPHPNRPGDTPYDAAVDVVFGVEAWLDPMVAPAWKDCPAGTIARSHNRQEWVKQENGEWQAKGGDIFPTPGADAFFVQLPGGKEQTKESPLPCPMCEGKMMVHNHLLRHENLAGGCLFEKYTWPESAIPKWNHRERSLL